MTKSYLLPLALVMPMALVSCSGGFSSSCSEYCDELDECSGLSDEDLAECKNDCSDLENDVEKADCESQATAYLDCINDLDCDDESDDCDDKLDDYSDCVSSYCNDSDSDDDICDDY